MDIQQPKIEKDMNKKLIADDIMGMYFNINFNNDLSEEVKKSLNHYLINTRFRLLKLAFNPLLYNSDVAEFLNSGDVYKRFASVVYNIALATNDSTEVELIFNSLSGLISLISAKKMDSLDRYKMFYSICDRYESLYSKLKKGYIDNKNFKKFNLELSKHYFNIFNSVNNNDMISYQKIKSLCLSNYDKMKKAECV